MRRSLQAHSVETNCPQVKSVASIFEVKRSDNPNDDHEGQDGSYQDGQRLKDVPKKDHSGHQ